MMHYHSAIVTIKDITSNKSCREYNHTRTDLISNAQVLLPFDAEYGISYKIMDGSRYRMEITIDGAEVTKDLVISGSGTIERFLDSDKRFKFVSANHPSVSDPTSSSNGGIEVKLFKEIPPPYVAPVYKAQEFNPHTWPNTGTPIMWGGGATSRGMSMGSGGTFGSCGPLGSMGPSGPQGIIGSSAGLGVDSLCCNVDTSFAVPATATNVSNVVYTSGLPGATIEGSKSSQTFGSTTWRGDAGEPLVFRFNLRGKVTAEPVPQVKRAIECPYCHTFNQDSAKFCSECGAKFQRS